MIYDTAIIGTGPAGISAALNLKIHQKKFIWLGSKALSDKISKAEKISNYPGLEDISGQEFSRRLSRQARDMGLEITEQMVNSIVSMGDYYALLAGNEFFQAKSIILATGVINKTALPGEERLLGKGVSYCATCDGPLYKGKTVAVICNASRFEHEVEYLSEIAGKVYYIPTYKAAVERENIEKVADRVVEIVGEEKAEGIRLSGGEVINVDGVFCLRNSVALSALLPKLTAENGHITVDRKMATNLPGIFAAGDCTGRPYQYAKAVGEGNVAAHSVIEYLAEKRSDT